MTTTATMSHSTGVGSFIGGVFLIILIVVIVIVAVSVGSWRRGRRFYRSRPFYPPIYPRPGAMPPPASSPLEVPVPWAARLPDSLVRPEITVPVRPLAARRRIHFWRRLHPREAARAVPPLEAVPAAAAWEEAPVAAGSAADPVAAEAAVQEAAAPEDAKAGERRKRSVRPPALTGQKFSKKGQGQ